jgi:tryptophanyl-tRNA synthetase
MTKKILTGFQPTGIGELHLGNYCGALYSLQSALKNKSILPDDLYVFVVDLHAMTIFSQNLMEKSYYMAKSLFAALNLPLNVNIYIQSHIKNMGACTWLLSMFTTTGEMNRMTQFKDKKDLGNSNIGLYTYPVLMAADILFLGAELISVGDDQKQHLETIRDISHRVNHYLPHTFIPPISYSLEQHRIMSLNDITKKMSKSNPSGCIFLQDSEEIITKKIMSGQTDNDLFPDNLANMLSRPTAYNFGLLYSIFADISLDEVIIQYKNYSWKDFKIALIQQTIPFCKKFQENFNKINDEEFKAQLVKTSLKINKIVDHKLEQVYKFFM